jgi:hypothetical protein
MIAVLAVVAIGGVGAGALARWGPDPVYYADPPPQDTAHLDARAREAIAVWETHTPQPARAYLPVWPYLPGWTGRSGHDPRPGRDVEIDNAISERRLSLATRLPDATPAPAIVRWADGGAAQAPVVSAVEAFAAVPSRPCLRRSCDGPPVRVTAATLGTVPALTANGWASVPAWLFTVEDAVPRIAHIAVDPKMVPEPMTPRFQSGFHTPVSHGFYTASDVEQRSLTVEFLGAPSGTGPCQAEYIAHAIEGPSAIAVIVQAQRRRGPEPQVACAPLGGPPNRRLTVTLNRPIGERTLLELSEGRPLVLSSRP